MYFAIFTGISIAMQLNNNENNMADFRSKKMDIAFVDCDKSEISEYIYDYLHANLHSSRQRRRRANILAPI